MRHTAAPLLAISCLLVAACQAGSPTTASRADPGQAIKTTDTAGMSAVPDCASGESATLADGLRVGYLGSDPDDPQRCLLQWSDRSHPLYFGFWNSDQKLPMSDEARGAFRTVLTGPVGTAASFATYGSLLWNRVTITHLANTVVNVAGKPRVALELRVVRHDALGRPDVRAETRYIIDRRTGVLLRSETVTPMADGGVTKTTSWQIGTLGQAG